MRILFLQKTSEFSGAESVVLQIMKLLKGHETFYASPSGEIQKHIEENGENFCKLEKINLRSIKKVINKIKPDVIHATDFTMSSLAAMVAGNIPVVSHIHNNPPWIKSFWHPKSIIYALTLPRIAHVILVSESISKEYKYSFLLKNKFTIINNFVNTKNVKSQAKKGSNIKPADFIFLGRLTYQKNPLKFCKIIKEIKKYKKNVFGYMVGRGELEEEIKNYINDNDLFDNIKLVGFVGNPYSYIEKSKVGIMPSRFEGFGLAAVEMLSLGKPVICNKVGGLANVVTDDAGKFCHNMDEYVNEAIRLLKDEEYYEKKSEFAVKRASVFSDEKKYKSKLEEIYQKVL